MYYGSQHVTHAPHYNYYNGQKGPVQLSPHNHIGPAPHSYRLHHPHGCTTF